MKGIIYIALFFVFVSAWSADQNPDGPFRILSDRSLYMAGETIRYRIQSTDPERASEADLSRVFYMELISPDGTSLSRGKNRLEADGGSGSIIIPRDLSSGNYYLKGYTRWMRREGPGFYNYLQVTIINGGKKTLLQLDTTSALSVQMQLPEPGKEASAELGAELEGRQERKSPLALNLVNKGSEALRCVISVVRKGTLESQMKSVPRPLPDGKEELSSDLIPETRGISISGKVQLASSGLPAPYALVYISGIGLEKEFRCNYADSSGRFYFTLAEGVGERDYFISARHPDDDTLDIFVDQDFCSEPLRLPSLPLDIDSSELELITSMWTNTQISDQYYRNASSRAQDTPGDLGAESNSALFFYGSPLKIVRFKDYINLPTLEEYFTELTPEVTVRRSKKKPSLRMNGPHPDLNFYDPLLMIDGVAIFDLESLLAVSPRLVDRFDIINAPYTRGNVTFGGIINVVTKKGDLGFIDLPSSGLLVRYALFNPDPDPKSIELPAGLRLPDSRNTFLWVPDLSLSPGEVKKLEFGTPDQRGTYEARIRGYRDQGQYIEISLPFIVD